MKVLFIYNGAESLGIEYLSSVLKSKGHETFLLFDPAIFTGDQLINSKFLSNFFSLDDKIVNRVTKINPDIIGFSAYTGNYRWCLKLAQKFKALFPSVPVVFGGVHVTAVPERVLLNDFIDYAVIGEGEGAIIDLVEHLEKGKPISQLLSTPNLCFKYKGKIRLNPPRPYIRDLDTLPFPDKKLFYKKVPLLAEDYMIMTSRGCPYDCTYCSNNMYHSLYCTEKKHVRLRSPENVIKELKKAKKEWKIRLINFADDIFTFSLPWLREFIPLYKSEINLPFFCSVHPLSISEETVALLKQGGCWLVTMGVQSGSRRIREKIFNRAGNNSKILESISLIKRAGIKISVDNIFGAPTETESDLKQSLKLYNQAKTDRILTFWLTYYPRTKIIDYSQRDKLLLGKDIEKIEDGITGFTHDTGSVSPAKIKIYLKYQVLFHLRSLVHNDKLYYFLGPMILLLPFKKLMSKLIIFLNVLKNKDIKFFYLVRFLWTRKIIP